MATAPCYILEKIGTVESIIACCASETPGVMNVIQATSNVMLTFPGLVIIAQLFSVGGLPGRLSSNGTAVTQLL